MLPLAREVARHLEPCSIGQPIRGWQAIDSTNRMGMAWAAEGAPNGAVVLAEYQTRGKGRHGRAWQAAAGQNLLFSVILRPVLTPARYGLLTLAGSLAVKEAIAPLVAPSRVQIKWPNDILIEGQKCCGILSESAIGPGAAVVIGIGLNVNQSVFPPDIADRATSVLLATGRRVDRASLMADVLRQLDRMLSLLNGSESALRDRYVDSLLGRGEVFSVYLRANTQISGRIVGITATGALRIDDGQNLFTVHEGELIRHVADT